MKKIALGFFGGFLIGSALHWSWILSPTSAEVSLGQIVYQRMAEFEQDVDIDQVLRVAKELAFHQRPLMDEKRLYDPLMAIAEKNVQKEVAEALGIAEKTLQRIKACRNLTEIVPQRVYIERLDEGKGERIGGHDLVSLQFKEYDPEGNLVKDTEGKSYMIPLSQTIKGFQLGLEGARVGETRKLYIHPEYGFGEVGRGGINKLLIYEVVITDRLAR